MDYLVTHFINVIQSDLKTYNSRFLRTAAGVSNDAVII